MPGQNFKSRISGSRSSSRFDETVYFQEVNNEPQSPICRFVEQREVLTRILGRELDSDEWRMKANLVTIGIVSSVETFFRGVIRRCLIIDPSSRATSYSNKLSYGAVLHHGADLLPEALLEESNFISKKAITKTLKEFLGLDMNLQQEPELSSALEEYGKVCQLRHCIAHRSGHLGSKNAIELGLDSFSQHLEKPISLTLDSVHNVFNICHTLVLESNDFVFDAILDRTVSRGIWTGDLRRDKKEFKKLHELFSPEPSCNTSLKLAYRNFIEHYGFA